MRTAITLCCFLMGALSTGAAFSQSDMRDNKLQIAIVAPFNETHDILAKQINLGAEAAKRANQMPVEFVYFPEYCDAAQDAKTAETIKQRHIKFVIGYLCSTSLEGAAPVLASADIAILSLGSRQPTIQELQNKQDFNIFRLTPDRQAAIDALITKLAPTWRLQPFAVLEDGTVQGRDFARQTLLSLKAQMMEPTLVENYRPAQSSYAALIKRLKRDGIHHILLGGDANDASIIARSAAAANFPLTIAGDEALMPIDDQHPLPAGLLISAIPADFTPDGDHKASKAIQALAEKSPVTQDMLADGYALPAFAAVQIAYQILTDDHDPLLKPADILKANHFDTATGTVSFTPQGLRRENPYRLLRFNGKTFTPAQ